MPKKKEKGEAKFLIFSLVSCLSFSQVYQLYGSLKKQVWFPDAIYPRLAFQP